MTRTLGIALALAWSGSAMAGGPVGPGVAVKQIAAPPQLVSGVKTLKVSDFQGLKGAEIAVQVKAELANEERLKTDAAAMGKAALDAGTDVAAQYAAGLVGGGIQGKIVQGLTKNTVTAVRDATEADPLILEDGLVLTPFTVVEGAADGELGGSVTVSDNVEDYKTKEAAIDSDGNVVKDADGNTVMIEVACRRRSVEVKIAWKVRGGAGAEGEVTRTGGDARCGGEIGNLVDANSIAEMVLGNVGPAIVRDLAPAWRVRRLPLNKTKVAKDAMKLVRKSDWENARCAFAAVAAANPEDGNAIFDHGVLLEAFGHFDAATALYDQAIGIKSRKVYNKAKARAAKRKAEVEAMTAAYGLSWTIPAEPPACGG